MTKEALGELIISSERQMYATAKTILADDQDCADAIQEAIVKAFTQMNHLREDRYAKTWLMRILINECYNLIRKGKWQMQYDDASVADVLSNIETEETKDYSELYEAVNTLKEELKIPIVLYYAEDFSVREISQVLEITEGAVQKRLVRARQQLKRKLKSMEVTI